MLIKIIKIKKIGHAGTLDPLASGVLPIALGEATNSGLLVTADEKTGLAIEAKPIILGGALQQKF